MEDLIGQTFGQYRIIEKIGAGGMATVYKAYQVSLDRYVALKFLPAQYALLPDFKERFLREARAVAQLSHPNILPIYGVGVEGDLSYFAMKYVPGQTLRHLVKPLLPLSKVCHFIEQAANALDHAHQHGILHRDIKPANMLLEDDWLLLADFGLAKIIGGDAALTATGAIMGTPGYMAPEQVEGKPLNHHADIYSLGVVLYELVTGQVPYQGDTPAQTMLKHLTEPLPPPRLLRPDLPEAVERVIIKALAKPPDKRYHRAGDLAQALRQAVTGSSSEAPLMSDNQPATVVSPPPSTFKVERKVGKLPLTYLLVGGGLVTVIGLLFWVVVGIVFWGLWGSKNDSLTINPTAPTLASATPGKVVSTPSPLTPTPELTGRVLELEGYEYPTKVDWASDSVHLASFSSNIIRILDSTSGKTQRTLQIPTGVKDIAWSSDGTMLAIIMHSADIEIRDANRDEKLLTLKGDSASWSSDGPYLAVRNILQIEIWDVTTGKELRILPGLDKMIEKVVWSPNGSYLALSKSDDNTIRIWDATNGKELYVIQVGSNIADVKWSPDSMNLAVLFASDIHDRAVRIWKTGSWEEVSILQPTDFSGVTFAWSPDGRQIAVPVSDVVKVLDLTSGKTERILQSLVNVGSGVAWSPNGKGVAAWGGSEGNIQIWSFGESSDTPHPPTATPLPTAIPTSTPTPLPPTWFFNNANQFTTTHTLTGHTDFVYDVAWSPDGLKLASASADKTIRLWDTAKGQPLQKLEGHTDIIMTVAWSPNGSRLASGGYDKTIRMWDVANAQPLKALTGHPSPVVSVAWSPDGSQLASAGWDDTVRAWDTANGQELWALTVPINERSYIALPLTVKLIRHN